MKKPDWDPNLYMKYNKERIQPSIDLVTRINFDNPEKIIDIGCGPGNSTQLLVQRWPGSKIIGADNSAAMIEKAKKDYPDQEWLMFDAEKDKIDVKFDIVFSNAALQWMSNQKEIIKSFFNLLKDSGLIAVQLPLFWEMPIGKSIAKIEGNSKWTPMIKGVKALMTIHSLSYYYDCLSELSDSIDIWITNYMHIMKSHLSILEMMRSTALKPYLERLKYEEEKKEFEELVLKDIKSDYTQQKNGNVIFPFKRLFFIAKK